MSDLTREQVELMLRRVESWDQRLWTAERVCDITYLWRALLEAWDKADRCIRGADDMERAWAEQMQMEQCEREDLEKDRDRWKAEATAARELLTVDGAACLRSEWISTYAESADRMTYAAARAANEGRDRQCQDG